MTHGRHVRLPRRLDRLVLPTLVLSLITSAVSTARAQKVGDVVLIAGGGRSGQWYGSFAGDGGPASEARFFRPYGLAVDEEGNLYVSDGWNHRIRKISPDGIITTVAGSGATDTYENQESCPADPCTHIFGGGFSGDGGPATQAQLKYPFGITLDAAGNLYIADSENHRVRKLSPDGTLTTVAGSSESGNSGDGGPAAQTVLSGPRDVAVDAASNLYIATYSEQIKRVDPSGVITTVAGKAAGACSDLTFGGPALGAYLPEVSSVETGAAGDLFLTLPNAQRVLRVDSQGTLNAIAGNPTFRPCYWATGFSGDGGPALKARLNVPIDVAVDSAGNVFIADMENHRIRKVDTAGVITSLAGPRYALPAGLTIDREGNLYIADLGGHRIYKAIGVAAPGLLAGQPFPNPVAPPGDLNGDRSVTLQDATLSLQIAIGLLDPTADQRMKGDMNRDAQLTLADTLLILQKAL